MKKYSIILASVFICLGLLPAYSQPGGPGAAPGGPHLGGATGKLFGDNQTFSATLEMQTSDGSGNNITMPGKISFDTGKCRFEFNLSDVKGMKASPHGTEQMKAMGLDQNVAIDLPDNKVTYLVFPGLQSYVQKDLSDPASTAAASDLKMEITEIGKETVDGHPCVKNKVVVTGKDGAKHESTVWNATDLKKFPVKIQNTEEGRDALMLFKNVSLDKPAASLFAVPSEYTKYDDMRTMMQQQMMKHMGGGGGMMGMPPH